MAAAGQPGETLSHCDAAVESDPEGLSRGSGGLANALVDRTQQAIADFEAFLDWVDESPKESCGTHYHPCRASWIKALKAGEDPFDMVTLREMRAKTVPPGRGPAEVTIIDALLCRYRSGNSAQKREEDQR